MDLLEASKDDRNTQRDGPDAVYAPLHPLTFSWEVSRHYHTFEKSLVKVILRFLNMSTGTAFTWIHFHRFVWLSWFWLNMMAVLTDSHSGNEPGRRTTKVFITFVDERTWNNETAMWSNFWHVLLSQVCFCCGGLTLPYAFSSQLTP